MVLERVLCRDFIVESHMFWKVNSRVGQAFRALAYAHLIYECASCRMLV